MDGLSTRLAEMLCTRLCHDLTGPVGALANGAEFLAEEEFEFQGQAIELISQSVEQAVNRLQFFRSAYGRINHDGEASLSDTKALIEKFFVGTKITLDWPDEYTDAMGLSVSRKMARLVYNLVQISMATLIRGGTLSIRPSETETTREIRITATGSNIKWDNTQMQALQDHTPLEEITPETVQAHYCGLLAKELNVTFHVEETAETFEIIATQQR